MKKRRIDLLRAIFIKKVVRNHTSLSDPVAAPAVGQHTERVLKEVLGYDASRLAELAEAGAFGDVEGEAASAKAVR